jgi:predicted Zn-dependent peptidase
VPPLHRSATRTTSLADDASDLPPAAGAPGPPEPIHVESFVLSNGLRVELVRRRGAPLVYAKLVVDEQEVDMGDALGRRASLLGATFLGARGARVSPGSCSILACQLVGAGAPAELGDVFGEMSDRLVSAGTPQAVLETRLTVARPVVPDLPAIIGHIGSALAFGRVGARDPALTDEPMPSLIDLDELRARAFAPAHATLAVVGDVPAETVRDEATRRFAGWVTTPGPVGPPAREKAPASSPPRLAFYWVTGNRVSVAVTASGPGIDGRDAPAFSVAADMLGAGFHSEDWLVLRDELGIAYTIRGGVGWVTKGGILQLYSVFDAPDAVHGMRSMLDAVARLRVAGLGDDAFERSRSRVLVRWRTTTPQELATRLGDLALLRREPTLLNEWPRRVMEVSTADIARVARKYLADDAVRVVLAGDLRLIGVTSSLGLGTPVRVDAAGRVQ